MPSFAMAAYVELLPHAFLGSIIQPQQTACNRRVRGHGLVSGFGCIYADAGHRCSVLAWSTMLLVLRLVDPSNHSLEKFFIPIMLRSFFLHASHHSTSTSSLFTVFAVLEHGDGNLVFLLLGAHRQWCCSLSARHFLPAARGEFNRLIHCACVDVGVPLNQRTQYVCTRGWSAILSDQGL